MRNEEDKIDISAIHFTNRFEKWATSAWTNLDLAPPCDLSAVSEFFNIVYRREVLPPGVLGMFTRNPDETCSILIASALPIEDQRRVWAHEIGHALLSKGLTGFIEYQCTVFNKNDKVERDCDDFARRLLMPEIILRTEAKRLGHTRSNNRLGTLASLFSVSKEDMVQRLRQIGI
jgi:Zn-dependent peptidase ImmA (M78 family)